MGLVARTGAMRRKSPGFLDLSYAESLPRESNFGPRAESDSRIVGILKNIS
jgi:hypothetical protein